MKTKLLVVALCFISLLLVGDQVQAAESTTPSPPTFTLPCGVPVVGVWETVKNEVTPAINGDHVRVAVFRSIPYAQPPTGMNRFRAPTDMYCPGPEYLTRSTESPVPYFNATQFRGYCPQSGWTANSVEGVEDCLFLTLHVPEWILSATTNAAEWPVLMYIYGGDLTSGREHEPLSFFAANTPPNTTSTYHKGPGVVVACPNYRLGALGWLAVNSMARIADAHGRSETEVIGNFGLQDQVAALRWLRQNVHAVGGDKKAVSIMGQSSGGTSVLALTQTSSVSDGLIRGGISLSGSPNITMGRTAKFAQDEEYAAIVNCPLSSDDLAGYEAQMDCLRHNVSVDTFVNQMPGSWDTPGVWNPEALNNQSTPNNNLNLAGLVYVDGIMLPHSIQEAMERGYNKNITLMFGNMGQEANFLGADQPQVAKFTLAQWDRFLTKEVFGTWGNYSNMIGSTVARMYGVAAKISPLLAYFSFNADYSIGCAAPWLATRAAKGRVAAEDAAPVYIFNNQWPPAKPDDNTEGSYAYHVWDYMCGIQDWTRYGPYTPTATDLELSKMLRGHWGSLIATGSVAPEYNWPEVPHSGSSMNGGYSTFVYANSARYPFSVAGAVPNHLAEQCQFFRHVGVAQGYWWCN